MTDREHPHALPQGHVRGRGAGLNPANRFDGLSLHVLGEHLDEQHREHPDGRQVETRVVPDDSRRIINHVDSPDLPFRWTINPYRGCSNGCVYCYARPTHEQLGYSCGLDFETIIHAKHDAPDLLRRELAHPRWAAEHIVMSGVTDPYQPLESRLKITRGCLEVMAECGQPVSMVTKNRMITRDLDLLGRLAKDSAAMAAISLTSLDPKLSRLMEPRASSPNDRLTAIRQLSDAGVPVQVLLAPIIPGLNEQEIPGLLEAAADAGAQHANWILLRLPYQVKDIFFEWAERHFPDRADRLRRVICDTRGGLLYKSTYGRRHRGEGPFATQINQTFDVFATRFKLNKQPRELSSEAFRRPALDAVFLSGLGTPSGGFLALVHSEV